MFHNVVVIGGMSCDESRGAVIPRMGHRVLHMIQKQDARGYTFELEC